MDHDSFARLPPGAEEYPEHALQLTAQVLGPHTAAAKCLLALRERRANGEAVRCYRKGDWFIVGP